MPDDTIVRRRNAAQTREAILAAARRAFSAQEYDQVGVREIAKEAGINAALVIRYFGSKEQLFTEAVTNAFDVRPLLQDEKREEPIESEQLSETLASFMMLDETDVEFYPLLALLRSAALPQGADLLRKGLEEHFIQPLAEYLEGDDAQLRANIVAALLLGFAVAQDIIKTEPLAQAKTEEIVPLLTPLLRMLLHKQCS